MADSTNTITLAGLSATDDLTIPGGANKSMWCLVRIYGTWNSASVSLTQDGVTVTDWSAITADQAKATLLKVGTLTATATGTPTSLTVEAFPVM